MAYPEDPLGVRIRIDPGADLTALPSTYTWPEDITQDVSFSRSRPITLRAGAADEQQESDTEATLTLRNFADRSSITQIDGRYTLDNPESDLFGLGIDIGCPVEISIDPGIDDDPTWYPVGVQYIAEEIPSWPGRIATDNMAVTQWTLAGLLRRIQQGRAVKSALGRTLNPVGDGQPVDYWPLESPGVAAETSVSWASPTFETPPATSTPAYAGALESVFGSYAGPVWYGKYARLNATFHGGSATMGSTDSWETGFALRLSPSQSGAVIHDYSVDIPLSGVDVSSIRISATYDRDAAGTIDASATEFTVSVIALDGSVLGSNPTTGINPFDDVARYLELEVVRTGFATFDVQFRIDGTEQFTLSLAGAPGYAKEIEFGAQGETASANNNGIAWSVTHLYFAYSDGDAYPVQVGWASRGYPGEMAHVRVMRLCNQEAVPVRLYDEEDVSTEMGEQAAASLVPLLRECEKADFGILDDHLGYINLITAREMSAIEPWLTVDGREREIFLPYAPVTDDLRARNDVIATKPSGGDGIRSYDQEDIDRRGRRDAGINPNVHGLAELAAAASMTVAQGTVPGKRYPSITLDFLRNPAVIPAWLDLDANGVLGKRIDVTGQPRAMGPQERDVRTQTRGYTLTITGRRAGLKLEATTVPYEPWDAGTFAVTGEGGTHTESGVNPARFDHSSSVIDDDLTTSTAIFDVVSETVRWINGARPVVDDPFTVDSASDWPTAVTSSSGWQKLDGTTSSDYTVSGGAGKHTITNTGNRRISVADIGQGDGWVYAEHTWPIDSPTTAGVGVRVYLRCTDASNYIAAHLELTTAGVTNLSVVAVIAGVSTTLLASTQVGSGHFTGQQWCILAGVEGTTVKVAAWVKGELPGSWPMRTMTDTAGVSTAGHLFGVASQRNATNANANLVSSWLEAALMTTEYGRMFPFDIEVGGERMTVSAITGTGLTQSFSVTRSVNGVTKSHDKDTTVTRLKRVRLWRPARVSLV